MSVRRSKSLAPQSFSVAAKITSSGIPFIRMSVFFDLPDDLCRSIITESIELTDVARMDVAVCFHRLRKQWLQFLPNCRGACDELSMLKWMNARNIKVTTLQPNTELLNSEWMDAISLHCRNLSHLTYDFPPTPETNTLLVDIFRVNNQLFSVELDADMELLQLLSPHSKSVKRIAIVGNLSCDAIVYVLENFMVIQSVAIKSSERFYISYDKKQLSLVVHGNYYKSTGWERFSAVLTDLQDVTWSARHYEDFSMQGILLKSCNTLTRLDFRCELPVHLLKSVLSQCKILKTVSCFCGTNNWPWIISETNQLEELRVSGPIKDMVHLLTICRHLKEVEFLSNDPITSIVVPALIRAIRDHRHAVTCLPLSYVKCISTLYSNNVDEFYIDCLGDVERSDNLWEACLGKREALLGESEIKARRLTAFMQLNLTAFKQLNVTLRSASDGVSDQINESTWGGLAARVRYKALEKELESLKHHLQHLTCKV